MSCQTRDVDRSFRCCGGAWEREARHAKLLAAELDIALDWQELSYYDVREMAALRLRLQHELRQGTQSGRSWTWNALTSRLRYHGQRILARPHETTLR